MLDANAKIIITQFCALVHMLGVEAVLDEVELIAPLVDEKISNYFHNRDFIMD